LYLSVAGRLEAGEAGMRSARHLARGDLPESFVLR